MNVEEEYRALRQEVLLRILIQNTILLILMPLLLAAVVAAACDPRHASEIGLAMVGATGMGALFWSHSAARTVQLKAYFRLMESRTEGFGWESWLAQSRFRGILGSRWFISTKGVFIGCQMAALVTCGGLIGEPLRDLLPLVLGGAVTLLTACLLVHPKLAP